MSMTSFNFVSPVSLWLCACETETFSMPTEKAIFATSALVPAGANILINLIFGFYSFAFSAMSIMRESRRNRPPYNIASPVKKTTFRVRRAPKTINRLQLVFIIKI